MLSNAITLAALTTVGFFVIYKKLPRNARKLIAKYNLISDVIALLLTYILFGGTVTALIAAALVSIVISVMLHIANHPDDYVWLTDSIKIVKDTIDKGKELIKQFNEQYKKNSVNTINMDAVPIA